MMSVVVVMLVSNDSSPDGRGTWLVSFILSVSNIGVDVIVSVLEFTLLGLSLPFLIFDVVDVF